MWVVTGGLFVRVPRFFIMFFTLFFNVTKQADGAAVVGVAEIFRRRHNTLGDRPMVAVDFRCRKRIHAEVPDFFVSGRVGPEV